jgi:hypothetical protein
MHDEEVEVEAIADDTHLTTSTFKQWMANMSAQNGMLSLVVKLADVVDGDGSDDDEFEDCEIDGETDRVIDLDQFQHDCSCLLIKWLDMIIERTRTLPHLLNLSR